MDVQTLMLLFSAISVGLVVFIFTLAVKSPTWLKLFVFFLVLLMILPVIPLLVDIYKQYFLH